MRMLRLSFFLLLTFASWWALGDSPANRTVVLLQLNGPIGPAGADYIARGLKRAAQRNAPLVIIELDTPGGLDTSMREIIQAILGSPVPVATYVAPSGARAASAGTFLLYASHIAAMSPGTTLGAATPVRVGGLPSAPKPPSPVSDKNRTPEQTDDAMTRKILNDSIAYIRSLAQMRGRNVDWAEKAVREAASLTAEEAVRQKVVDLQALDVSELLVKIDGRIVNVLGQDKRLETKGLEIQRFRPDWRFELLSTITNPNVLPILMMLGVFGLFYELLNPGFVLPGVIGAICLLLGLYASHVMPVNYAGLALIMVGIVFMVAEAFVPSFGALGIGGVIAFVAGSIMLIETDVEGFQISWIAVISTAVFGAAAFGGVATLAARAHQRRIVSGSEEMIGSYGEASMDFDHKGRVHVHSEEWNAETTQAIEAGQKIKVIGIEGLLLKVEPVRTEEN